MDKLSDREVVCAIFVDIKKQLDSTKADRTNNVKCNKKNCPYLETKCKPER